ncbi:Sialic acid-binding Ig-like lectin 8 [Fukomys damarensis]|uniref:Sialic acid-binding Ig-like lectin 8 n=1 Tax=Fukomys damarensis TaxID=885580 RepID=A0A091CJ53_FUKDA|nr:Sialic acid-binding Ig-like lectin 8 [Fukomys damarensis]
MLLLLLLLLLLLPARLLWAQEGAWWRDFSLKVQSRVKVQEGLCVHVPCVFTTLGEWTESDAAHGYCWWLGWAPCEAPGRPSVLPGPESRWTEPSGSEPGLGSCPLPCLLITQAPVPLPLSLRLNLPPLCLLPCPSRNRFATLTLRVFSTAPTALANGSSLPVVAGQALRLLCAVDSDPPARLTWSWGNLTLCPSEPANPGVLELTPQHLRGEGEFTCRAQNSLGSQRASLSLSLQDHEGLPPKGLGVTGVTLGAVAGAGTTALLFLSFCIVLVIIWSCRKKSAKPAASKRDPIGTSSLASQGPLVESQPDDSSSHQPPPSVTALSSEEEEEIHYASLSFHRVKPRDPQDHQSITSEYSEIKIHE